MNEFSRRSMLQGAAAAGTLASFPVFGQQAQSLDKAARAKRLRFGCAFDVQMIHDLPYVAILQQNISLVTPENSLKMIRIRRNSPDPDWSMADQFVAFAKRNGWAIHGHNLIWNDNTPIWLQQLPPNQVGYWLDRHIEETAGRYAGSIEVWDVVNEPFNMYFKKPGDFRDGPWFAALGPDYVRRSLAAAAKADPKARLVINETFIEHTDQIGLRTRTALLKLIDDLQHQGVRLDGIALESHLNPSKPWSKDSYETFLGEIAERKLDIMISELDVLDSMMPADVGTRDQQVAGWYRDYLTSVLKNPRVTSVQTWQMSDKYSWLQSKNPAGGRPLPYDSQMNPKPARDAILQAFGQRA